MRGHAGDGFPVVAKHLMQLHRPLGRVQLKNRLAPTTDDVHIDGT